MLNLHRDGLGSENDARTSLLATAAEATPTAPGPASEGLRLGARSRPSCDRVKMGASRANVNQGCEDEGDTS